MILVVDGFYFCIKCTILYRIFGHSFRVLITCCIRGGFMLFIQKMSKTLLLHDTNHVVIIVTLLNRVQLLVTALGNLGFNHAYGTCDKIVRAIGT